MNQIACSFAPGFEKIIEELIKSRVNDAQKFNVSSGFVYFFSSQNPIEISSSLDFCNNVFLILKDFSSSLQFKGLLQNLKKGEQQPFSIV